MDIYVSEFGGRKFLAFGEVATIPVDAILSITFENEAIYPAKFESETRPVAKVWSAPTTVTLRTPDEIQALKSFIASHGGR